jgi:hypothetical protein
VSRKNDGIALNVKVAVDPIDLVNDNRQDDLFAFIVQIDEGAQDWDFTLRLCDYFDEQRAAYIHETGDDAAPVEAKP